MTGREWPWQVNGTALFESAGVKAISRTSSNHQDEDNSSWPNISQCIYEKGRFHRNTNPVTLGAF